MYAEIPHLAFVPVDKLIHHEQHDDSRTRPLVLRLRSNGVMRNPPVVCPLPDGSGRYMILDGANRITALGQMGCPHALVQIVPGDHKGLSLQTWNHVVWEMNSDRFLNNLRKIPGLRITLCEPTATPSLEGDCGLAHVRTCRGRTYSLCAEEHGLESRVSLLNSVVNSYVKSGRIDRTNSHDVTLLREVYPLFSGLVIFPRFEVQDILCLSGQGCLLPTGITRFTISPRALHVNYPLTELESQRPLEEKNEALQQWLRDRLDRKGVRYYAEATFLFDE